MPRLLSERLYKAFAADINSKLDVNDFISSLAVIGSQDRSLVLRFLFRVYDIHSSGNMERHDVEEILKLAYGIIIIIIVIIIIIINNINNRR